MFFLHQVFDMVRIKCPSQLDKLTIIPGDITKPNLGISVESIALLREVSIIIKIYIKPNYNLFRPTLVL